MLIINLLIGLIIGRVLSVFIEKFSYDLYEKEKDENFPRKKGREISKEILLGIKGVLKEIISRKPRKIKFR